MSVAAVAPKPAPAPAAKSPVAEEPRDLRELYAQARTDLGNPTNEAHLRWIFWHARAVGRLEIARMGLRKVDLEDYEAKIRAMNALPSESMRNAWEQQRPHETTMRAAQEVLIEHVTYVEAAARVCALLDGMWGRR